MHLEEFLERPVSIDFMFFEVDEAVVSLERAGFTESAVLRRGPYPDVEAQTRRAYVRARKPVDHST